jgi:hypothetical protein
MTIPFSIGSHREKGSIGDVGASSVHYPKGESNNARSAKQTRVNGDLVTAYLEETAGRGDEPDVSAGGLCHRNVAGNRAGGACGKPETGAKPAPN